MVAHRVQRLAEAPLTDLFPGIVDESLARLAEIDDRLSQARLPADLGDWRWYDKHVNPPPKTRRDLSSLIIGTAVSVYQGNGDWLELAIDIWQSMHPLRTVTASVEVGCWCETNHNMHTPEQREWVVGTDEGLVRAVGAAVRASSNGWTALAIRPSGAGEQAFRTDRLRTGTLRAPIDLALAVTR